MENLLQVRSFGVNFYVLRDERGLVLLDAGFLGGRRQLRRALLAKGWGRERIYGIVVTHGHLDHILNVGKVAQEPGAWIAAPAAGALHYEGRPSYQGLSQVTGVLEREKIVWRRKNSLVRFTGAKSRECWREKK